MARIFEHMEQGIPDLERDFALRQALKTKQIETLASAVDSLTNFIGHLEHFNQL